MGTFHFTPACCEWFIVSLRGQEDEMMLILESVAKFPGEWCKVGFALLCNIAVTYTWTCCILLTSGLRVTRVPLKLYILWFYDSDCLLCILFHNHNSQITWTIKFCHGILMKIFVLVTHLFVFFEKWIKFRPYSLFN